MAKPVNMVHKVDVRGSHQVACRVEVLQPESWEAPTVLRELWEVVDGTVSFDANADTRGRVSLTLPATEDLIPTSPWDLLAPFGNEIRVSRGVEFNDRIDLVQLGIFRIDSCSVTGNEIHLEGLDRAATFVDASWEWSGQYEAGQLLTDVILDVLIGGSYNMGFGYSFNPSPAVLPWPVVFEETDSRWDFVQNCALAINSEMFFDSQGVLILTPIAPDHGGADSGTYNEGPDGILMSASRNFDRSTLANMVIVTGENGDDTNVPRGVAIDENVASPTYFYGRFGHKPVFTQNSFVGDNDMAKDMANGILRRSKGAPDAIEFESIVTPHLRPSNTVIIVRERLGLNEKHVVDAVDIPLGPAGTMRVRTRAVELTNLV